MEPTKAEGCRGGTRQGFCCSGSSAPAVPVTVVYTPFGMPEGDTFLPLILKITPLHSGYD